MRKAATSLLRAYSISCIKGVHNKKPSTGPTMRADSKNMLSIFQNHHITDAFPASKPLLELAVHANAFHEA